MEHEVDLKKYELRTDLIIENKDFNGINNTEIIEDDIKVTETNILDDNNILNKKKGKYITIEFIDITDSYNYKKVLEIIKKELYKLLKIKKNDFGLIIGLGNKSSTPDSIGPLTIKDILVTNHIYMYDELDDGFRRVAAIAPGVTGENGIETSEYIKGIVDTIRPDFVIIIDALASRSIERLNRTIQMTDTGISPGSGVGNSRKEISEDTLGIPVYAIGVPTVVDAVSVVADTLEFMNKHYAFSKEFVKKPISKLVNIKNINYLNKKFSIDKEDRIDLLGLVGSLDEIEIRELISEVLTPIGYNLMVTPKEIDFIILKLSKILSDAINYVLHDNYKEKSLNDL